MEQLRPGDPSRVGNYRLIGRLGEGGMGQVFLGLSPGGRQVAVKVIHPEYASGKQFRERFAREIEAARRVGGYYTASVVDADPAADSPWMVTAFIPGPSLQQAVAAGGPFSLERVRQIGAGLAEGLAAIHARGLVHRDLKPSNVILADDGPRIIDFGIARAAEASPMTTAGMVVGTYSYMSPEQLRGEVAGPASDVFALGCTLAFAATARVTFGEDSIVTVMYRITTEPPDLTGVPEENGFRPLISECLAKNPAERPALAAIMERLAGPGSPAVASGTGAASGAGAAGGSSGAGGDSARSGQAWPPGLSYEPTQTMRAGDQTAPGSDRDAQLHRTGDPLTRKDHLATGPNGPNGPNGPQDQQPAWAVGPAAEPGGRGPSGGRRRGLLIGAAAAVVAGGVVAGLLLSSGSPQPSHPMAAQSSAPAGGHSSPRATVHASPGVPTQPQLALRDPKGKNVFGDVFSSQTVLATGDGNGNSYLWNVATGKPLSTIHDPNSNGINSVAFNSASNSYAIADANGSIYLWSASGKLIATLSNGSRDNDRVAMRPDGSMVAVGSSSGNTYLWDVAAGQANPTSTSSLHDPGGKSVYGVAFSPNGSLLAAGDTDGSTYLWNVATGRLAATLKDPGSQGLYDVAFSPDGRLLAVSDVSSSTTDGIVYLWNVATGKLTGTLASFYDSDFADIAFTPDGRFLAAGDTIGHVSFWNVATGKYLRTLSDPLGKSVIGVAFSPAGDLLASTDTAGDAYVWNTKWLGS